MIGKALYELLKNEAGNFMVFTVIYLFNPFGPYCGRGIYLREIYT
jgi:hypothetical protein